MSEIDADFALALQLQEQFNEETLQPAIEEVTVTSESNSKPILTSLHNSSLHPTSQGVVDIDLETVDPNPDIHALFLHFNDIYFDGKLAGIEVKWSTRMTLCAGLCCYEGRGGLCSVRLSEPLLKFRPRKDLVQTLLHEMIHAYLFVTQNNKDHDAHGPEFLKHMKRINAQSGANITVYHNFHDEVDLHRKHWWLCNGPCRLRKPYFGIVKRAMNRPPSSRDFWWEEHRKNCGGTYSKIKGPEFEENQKVNKRKVSESNQITKKAKAEGRKLHEFFPVSNKTKKSSSTGIRANSSQTVSASSKSAHKVNNASETNSSNLFQVNTPSNIHSFSDKAKNESQSTSKPFVPIPVSNKPVKSSGIGIRGKSSSFTQTVSATSKSAHKANSASETSSSNLFRVNTFSNIHSFSDNGKNESLSASKSFVPFSGKGHVLQG